MKIKLGHTKITAVLFCFILFATSLRSQVIINEYSCSNLTVFTDNFGFAEDWIELYNPTASPVNLTGYCLSNKTTNPAKWKFGNVTINPNSFLRIWASGRNVTSGVNLHTNFSLTQCKSDKILFSSPALVLLDSLTTQRTQLGHSRGRTTNGAATWSVFIAPTPNASNNTATPYLGYATTPSMNIAPGFYPGAQNVSITSPDAGVSIRYTTNGFTPNGSSALYSAPINISSTKVLRAIASSTNASVLASFVESNSYFINVTHTVNVVSAFGDQLLTLITGTQINPEVGLEYFEGSVFKTESYGQSNKHGNDSWFYNQRAIDFVSHDEYGINNALKHPIFNSKNRMEYQRIILKAAANDNYPFEGLPNSNFNGELGGAHIRDSYIHTVSQKAKMHLDERTWAPAILYVNGAYWGVYDVREKVDDKDFTKHYYNSSDDSLQYLQTWGSTWSAYGGTQAQTDWNTLKNYITSNSMTNPANYNYVVSQLDEKSLADYVILNSYVVCSDWLNWNTAWWRATNVASTQKKWKYSLWDEDATFKHYINYTGVPNLNANANPCDPQSLGNPGSQGHVPILNALLTNPTFKQYYVMRYFDLINSGLSCQRMTTILDSMVLAITPEMPGQVAKWGGTMVQWQQNVAALKFFIQQRCDSVTKHFNGCYSVTGPYKIKINVAPLNSGTVDFNSLNLTNFTWSGTYPGSMPNNLKANAKPGYCFSHWTTLSGVPLPATTNSAVTITLSNNDSIVAHFIPIPNVNIAATSATVCYGNSVQLSASGASTYTWAPTLGLSCSTCSNPVAFPNVGTIVYTVSSGSQGCKSSKTETVIVSPSASANFTFTTTQNVLPETVTLINNSNMFTATGFYWWCSNGSTSTNTVTSLSLNYPALYDIVLVAYGANGCNDTIKRSVFVSDTAGYYPPYVKLPLPNIFTPNNDGSNDFFFPVMRYVTEMNCLIYDRWGKLEFEMKEVNDKWNGTNIHGKESSPGTYFYIFKAKDRDGKDYSATGYIQLQR
ncbi:MAG: CotH kinase family protein [Bacteroidetes bacterium]|nr:CotH kinase family protein [Bacteroidota bacterium]